MNLRLFFLVVFAAAFTAPTLISAQISPDDQKHWAEVAHKLEAMPLDEALNAEVGVTIAEIAVSGIHVTICPEFYSDFSTSKYVHHAQIRWLYMLGATAYQVETGKTDSEGTNLYALHSVLKGYAAILKQEPTAKDKTLDELSKADSRGKLPDLITQKNCNRSTALAALR